VQISASHGMSGSVGIFAMALSVRLVAKVCVTPQML
jgi:hypothetical protein